MNKIGKYIYGVINSNTEEFFDLGEIVIAKHTYPLRSPADAVSNNQASNRAYTICFQDIAAIVRDSEIVDYNHMPKDTLARLLVSHQQLIEKVMTRHTVVPMRLGTFAQNNEEVEEILVRGYKTIKDICERAKNSMEIDVAATLNDFNSFLHEISEQQEIKQLKQSLLDKKGGVTIDEQMRVGVLVKKQLDKKKETLADQIHTALGKIAQDCKVHDLMDDQMVFNAAFLIVQNRQEEFEQKVAQLNDEFEDKLNFRCVGPLPPYSFYTLEVKRAQFEEVNWAKEKLGLRKDFITAGEIKKAHRRTAMACHPDKNPDSPDIEEKFDEMTRAYRILLDYYRASEQIEHGQGCYLNEEAFERNAVLVTTMA